MTAQNLHLKIYSNLLDEIEKLVQILSKDSDIKEIDEYRLEALSKLEGIIKEVKENIKSLEINSEWYKFTIGFYGETNAGKSTLIETVRILLKEETKESERESYKSQRLERDKLERQLHSIEVEINSINEKFFHLEEDLQFQLTDIESEHISKLSKNKVQILKIEDLLAKNIAQEEIFSHSLLRLYVDKDELVQIIFSKMISSPWNVVKSWFHKIEEQSEVDLVSLQITELENTLDGLQSITDQYEKEIFDLTKENEKINSWYHNKKIDLEKQRVVLIQQMEQLLESLVDQLDSVKETRAQIISKLKNLSDGIIIGDGRSDFTQEVRSYEFNVGDKEFVLLDLPGIEGKEHIVQESIKSAVEKAHVIFYVSKSPTPPQKGDNGPLGTIEKISKQLSQQNEVYFLYNKPIRNVRQLRKPLINENEEDSLSIVDIELSKIFEENYISHLSLSAYPAFLSIGNFYDNKFSKDKEKFSEKLGNSDIIFEMSQVKEFVNWMTGKLVNDVINKITRSNLKKIKKTLEWTTTEIKEVTNSFNKLEVKLHSNYKLTSRILDEASETFEMNLENTVYKSLRILKSNTRKKIYSIINNGISDKGFEKELKKIVEKELKNFSIDLNKKIEKQSKDFKDEMSEIVSTYQRYVDELVEHYAKSVKFEFDFQPNIKIKRNINIGNVLMALLGDIIGIISTALNMSNPVGWVILGLSVLSTFFHVYKIVRGAIDKNFQKSQQRKNADENIEKVVKTIQQELGKYLIETMSEVNKHLAELTKLMYEPVWQIKSMSETFIEVENKLKFLSNELDKKGEKYYGNS